MNWDGWLTLPAAVIKKAIDDKDIVWFRSPCGSWWLDVLGLDPNVVWENVSRGTSYAGLLYAVDSDHDCQKPKVARVRSSRMI